jgi:hypothetical protein
LLNVDKCLDCAPATSQVGPDPTPKSAGQGAPDEFPSRSREEPVAENQLTEAVQVERDINPLPTLPAEFSASCSKIVHKIRTRGATQETR